MYEDGLTYLIYFGFSILYLIICVACFKHIENKNRSSIDE
jgi:hypothetical protein